MATKTTTDKPAKTKAEKPPVQPCACACGDTPKRGSFLPGHDARLKSRLRADMASTNGDVRTRAEKRATSLGWKLEPATPKVAKAKKAAAATA